MSYVDKINFFNLSRTAKQTIALYISQMLAMVFGFLFTIVNTHYLSREDFGTLNFYLQIITFIALIFEFGYYSAGSRLIAVQQSYQEEREVIGALTIIGLILSAGFIFILFGSSLFVDSIFNSDIKYILLLGLIPSAAYPYQYLLQLIFQGSNEVIKLSAYNVLPRLFYFAAIGFAVLFGWFSLTFSALASVISLFIVTIIVIFLSRPAFSNLKTNIAKIKKETKEYGFQVYTGRIAGMMGYQSNILLIQYFVREVQVANYSLVNFFTTPISIFSRSLCTSLFKGFTKLDKIPARVFVINYIWLGFSSLIYIFAGGFIMSTFFSSKYEEAIPLILPMTIANICMGAFQPYNFFLSAKGKGKYLRNTAILLTVSTLVFNFIMIPYWGAIGAAYATVISLLLDFLIHYYYYKKTLEENRK